MNFAKGTIVQHDQSGTRYESDGKGGWTSLKDGYYYKPGVDDTWALRDEEIFARDFTIIEKEEEPVSNKIELKAGDKVRLTGDSWYGDGEPAKGEVYTLTGTDQLGRPTFEAYDYPWFVDVNGYEVERVTDEPAAPEAREVNLGTVVSDTKYLIGCLMGLGFSRTDARDLVLHQIEQQIILEAGE